jgi:hypothetical protein
MHERRDDDNDDNNGGVGRLQGIHTEHIALVEPIGGNDCEASVLWSGSRGVEGAMGDDVLVMRRLGWPAPSMMRGCAAQQAGWGVRRRGSGRQRQRGGSQSSRWLGGPLLVRRSEVVMSGVGGLAAAERRGYGTVQYMYGGGCAEGDRASTKANAAAGFDGAAREASGLRCAGNRLYNPLQSLPPLEPTVFFSTQPRRPACGALRRRRCDAARMPPAALALAPQVVQVSGDANCCSLPPNQSRSLCLPRELVESSNKTPRGVQSAPHGARLSVKIAFAWKMRASMMSSPLHLPVIAH